MKIGKIGNCLLSILNILWKLGVIAIGVSAVFFAVFIIKEFRLEKSRSGFHLSDYLTEYKEDGYVKLYNERDKKFTLEDMDWVSHGVSEDRIGVFSRNLKRGFFDYDTGYPLSDNTYDKAWNFSEGLGAVETNGMLGFVDRDIELAIPQKFKITRASDAWPDAIQFHDAQCILRLTPDSVGVINKSGEWVVPPIYEDVSELSSDSCRIVRTGGLAGILDYNGNTVIPIAYDAVRITNPNEAVVARDGVQKKITYSGEELLAFVYDDVQEFSPENPQYLKYEVNGHYGVIDRKTYRPLIPALYSSVDCLSGNKFVVGLNDTENHQDSSRFTSYIIVDSHNRKVSEK